MKASRHIRKSHISIGFVGRSGKFPIHFSGRDLLEKVFSKIMTIEETREFSRHGSSEDLNT